MLNLSNARSLDRSQGRTSRRTFLQIGAFGAGLSMADVLRLRAETSARTGTKTRQKSIIMVWLGGAPSHIDTYDPKPNAPIEIRGEFKAISTQVPGLQFCEHLPLQASIADKLTIIRSVKGSSAHSDDVVMTGYSAGENAITEHPSFGSVVSKVRPSRTMPSFVSLRGLTRGTDPGFLGVTHMPFTPGGEADANLRLADGLTADQIGTRKVLLKSFDDLRRDLDTNGAMVGMDSFTSQALDMVTSGKTRDALDLSIEDPKTCARYKGIETFLTALRLAEAGVGCITVGGTAVGGNWDTHQNNFGQLKNNLLPTLDRAIYHLVTDIYDRGMQNDVAVLVWGEFGRTPKINRMAGRDHWGDVMSAVVAGGGFKVGQAIGQTNDKAERATSRPYTVQHVLTSMYRYMGIDPSLTFPDNAGRPVYILDDRDPVVEL